MFFSDTQCNLKSASVLLKSQDVDGALKQSEENLAACKTDSKVKPGTLARAYYNLGVLQFIRDDYEAAIGNLTDAQKLDNGSVFVNALADCRKAQDFSAQLAKYNEDRAPSALSASESEASQKALKSTASKTKQVQQVQSQSGGASAEERLTKLDELLKKKLITQDEYSLRRKAVIDGL